MFFLSRYLLLPLVAVSLTSCSGHDDTKSTTPWQQISGRDEGTPSERSPIYRAQIPDAWQRVDPSPDASNVDSKLPICEFTIQHPAGAITIAIHNFPYDTLEQRVPPPAQVARWQRQLSDTNPTAISVGPYGHGGYAGLQFEATGTLKDTPNTTVLAWAMQLSQEHFRNLQRGGDVAQRRIDRQQRGDYTIKATGPVEAIAKYRRDIELFARSFELINEVPSR